MIIQDLGVRMGNVHLHISMLVGIHQAADTKIVNHETIYLWQEQEEVNWVSNINASQLLWWSEERAVVTEAQPNIVGTQKTQSPIGEISSGLRMELPPCPWGHTISKGQPSYSMATWLQKENARRVEKEASDAPTEDYMRSVVGCYIKALGWDGLPMCSAYLVVIQIQATWIQILSVSHCVKHIFYRW